MPSPANSNPAHDKHSTTKNQPISWHGPLRSPAVSKLVPIDVGEARQQPAANDTGESYTGHITDTDTGLVYMQARYYDPAIGRFLSQDPMGFAQGGVGYFNRYAYVGNDPLNMTDPTGEFGHILGAGALAGAVGFVTNAAVQQLTTGEVNWRDAAAAGGGAALERFHSNRSRIRRLGNSWRIRLG